jgi:hypothetical protein
VPFCFADLGRVERRGPERTEAAHPDGDDDGQGRDQRRCRCVAWLDLLCTGVAKAEVCVGGDWLDRRRE